MLRFKLFRWFAVLVLLFGALSAYFSIRMIGQRVVDEAQRRVRYDLSSAWAVYQSQLRELEVIVRLTAARTRLVDALETVGRDPARREELQAIIGKVRLDFGLDFLTLVNAEGQVAARGAAPYATDGVRAGDPIISRALTGAHASGALVLSREALAREGGDLADRAFLVLQGTPHARPTTRVNEDRGMVVLAASPVDKNGRVIGALYGGILLNRNQGFVDRIQSIVFGAEEYRGSPVGTVTVFLADTRVTTTVRLANGNRAIGTRVSSEVADRVLDNGAAWLNRAFVVKDWYLTAYDPIRDPQGGVIGMLYVGILERPFTDLRRAMVLRYSGLVAATLVLALALALFIAGRLARPLHQLAEAANRMERGERFDPVAGDGGCHETAGLIRAFNDMAATLATRERQLRDANTSLKAVNKDYMETLQFVSHEVKSPLASMINYSYLLRQEMLGPLTEKQRGAAQSIDAGLKRLTEMVRHYLSLSRIENGELRPARSTVRLHADVLAPTLAALEAETRARRQRVESHVDPHLTVSADLPLLREVFENLLGNAAKYGREGGLIRVECRPENGRVACTVWNEGPGIPAEHRDRLFQKFSRFAPPDAPGAPRGTGLGLFITRKIIEAHGGAITADSRPGEWAEFRFTLPREGRDGPPAAEAPLAQGPARPA